MPERTPHDLALFVYGRLKDDQPGPSIEILDDLFQTLFLTSLMREEGTPVSCSICYVDPRNPDPDPPQLLRDPRWRYTPLGGPLEYNVNQLAKLGLAADTSSSSLAVYPDGKSRLKIWGIFDQQGGFESLLSHESDGGWEPPGIVQAQILEVGHIIVTDGLTVIAELNGGRLVEDSVDVFEGPIVTRKLTEGFERRSRRILEGIKTEGYRTRTNNDLKDYGLESWTKIIRRILLRARAFGRGRAFLLTDSDYSDRLRVTYSIVYNRLPVLFENWQKYDFIADECRRMLDCDLDEPEDYIDPGVYWNCAIAEGSADDAKEAMAGAVGFVASLSRIDGLVLMDTDFVVRGFGCEITAKGDSKVPLLRAMHSRPTKKNSRVIDVERFGTRHRSMVRYCSEDESAVGFVVSSDGPVRAITRSGGRVFLWDNVRLGMRA